MHNVKSFRIALRCSLAALSLAVCLASPASAQTPAARGRDAPAGKPLELIVSEAVGGGSDTMARLVARHIGKHMPGAPNVLTRNMPGAGGLSGTNYLYNIAPKDGSVIGLVEQSVHSIQLFRMKGLMADVRKFNWIGRIISNNAILFSRAGIPVTKIQDAYTHELTVSATGQTSQMRWTMLKRMTDIKFNLIVGHRGTAEASLAMERGEVDAVTIPWVVFRVSRADWIRDGKVNLLLQSGLERAADLQHVPRVVDLGRTEEERRILALSCESDSVGRSFVLPPGTAKERVDEWRAAFAAMLVDAEFLAEVKTMQLVLDPLLGAELQDFITKSFDYPAELIDKAEILARTD